MKTTFSAVINLLKTLSLDLQKPPVQPTIILATEQALSTLMLLGQDSSIRQWVSIHNELPILLDLLSISSNYPVLLASALWTVTVFAQQGMFYFRVYLTLRLCYV